MIKVKIESIILASSVMKELMNKNFSAVESFKIARLVRAMDSELELFNDQRDKMILKYGERKEEVNGGFIIKPQNIEAFNKEIDSLVKTKVELNAEKISMDFFKDITLTPEQGLYILDFVE